jgi:hypothetical protein
MAHVFANSTVHVRPGVLVTRGEAWSADDPIVLERPDLFTADPAEVGALRRSGPPATGGVVEQATAEPGERRNLPKPGRQQTRAETRG